MNINVPAGQTSGVHAFDHGDKKDHCSTTDQVERLYVAGESSTQKGFVESRLEGQAQYVDMTNKVDRNGSDNLRETVHQGEKDRHATEKFGLYNAGISENGADRNFAATKDGAREILLNGARDTASILVGQTGGFKDGQYFGSQNTASINSNISVNAAAVALQNATNTGNVILGQTVGFKDGLIQACGNTASIKEVSHMGFRDGLLQASNNQAAIQQSVASGFCAVEREVLGMKGSIELQAANNKASLELEAAKNKAALELDAAKNLASVQMTATINAKDAAMTASINHASLLQKIAECCCEQKALVIEKSSKTDDLIRQLQIENLRDSRESEHVELVALRLRASLVPALVPSVSV
jgi:hypothetical protein